MSSTYGRVRTVEWYVLSTDDETQWDSGSLSVSAYSTGFTFVAYGLPTGIELYAICYIYNPEGSLLAQGMSSSFTIDSSSGGGGGSDDYYWQLDYSSYGNYSSNASFYFSTNPGEIGFCYFTPSQNGTLKVYSSSCSNDTYGWLSADNFYINESASSASSAIYGNDVYAANDQGGSGNNFSYTYEVTTGGYYVILFSGYYVDSYESGYINIEFTPTISSWQSPVQMASISGSSYSSYSSTTSVDCYRAGYVRFYAPANGQIIFKTTSNSTSPNYYSYLSTSTLSAGSGTDRSGAVTGYLTSNDDGAGTGYDTQITYTVSSGNYYYWYVNAAWSSSGTYSIPWSLTYKRAYTVTYNANGGSGAPSTGTYYLQSTPGTITLNSTTPTRSGYTFLGWSTSSSATSASYSAGGTMSLSANTTLYAVWRASSYTISYNANAGSDTTKNIPSSQTKTYGTALILSSLVPLRYGYTFQGWATSSSATSATYRPGASFTTNATTTLYAVWAINTYIVSFNANGGSGAPSSFTKTYGSVSTIPTTVPTREGYTFLGWSTESAGLIVSYQPGDSYDVDLNTTLYAVWSSNTIAPNIGKRQVFFKKTNYPARVYLGSVEQLVWLNWDTGEE